MTNKEIAQQLRYTFWKVVTISGERNLEWEGSDAIARELQTISDEIYQAVVELEKEQQP